MAETDPAAIVAALQQWTRDKTLDQAQLTEQGLEWDGKILANQELTIEVNGNKTYKYSLASIFLQIVHPKLVAYRAACKKHNVKDPLKALDKTDVIGFFEGTVAAAAADAAPAPPADAAAAPAAPAEAATTEAPPADAAAVVKKEPSKPRPPPPPPRDKKDGERRNSKDHHYRDRHHKSSSKSHHHDKKRKHSSSSKDHHHRSSKHHKPSAAADDAKATTPKKKPKEVTNEELFSNLGSVVERRSASELDESRLEITKALSADGFEVTPELLERHREAAQLIFDNEIPVGNSASILRAANPRKDLTRVLQIFNETVNPPKPPKKLGGGRGGVSFAGPSRGGAGGGTQRPYLLGKRPVIVVPKGMTAPITLVNAFEFFANGKFVPRDVAIQQGLTARSAKSTFTRPMRNSSAAAGGATVEYEIVDNPKKLLGTNIKEWERIVAVLALGQGWQFKDWLKEYSNPVQLFARTFGFFVSLEGDRLPQEVATWSVKQAKLNRDKRGLDSVTFALFWNGLDNWMTVNRRELLPQTEDG